MICAWVALWALGSGLPFSAQAQNVAPKLRNVTVTSPVAENDWVMLTGTITDANLQDIFSLVVDWGEGWSTIAYYTNLTGTVLFTNYYQYAEDGPTTNTAASYTYTIKVTAADNHGGSASTNRTVTVTNVPPSFLELRVNSPIDLNSPTNQRGLVITEYDVPTADSGPNGITVGPDNALWFTESNAKKIGRITTGGAIKEFIATNAVYPQGITTGPDNRLWFTDVTGNKIGRLATNGNVALFNLRPSTNDPVKYPEYITSGPDQALWFTEFNGRLGRITTTGTWTEYVIGPGHNLYGITAGPDNAIWFADFGYDLIWRSSLSGNLTNFPLSAKSGYSEPALMTRGPDNALWFCEFQSGYIGRAATNGAITEGFVARSLPHGITTGADGAIWFTELRSNSVTRLATNGMLHRIALCPDSQPMQIVSGPDGALWFTEPGRNKIGRIAYSGTGNVLLTVTLNDPGALDRHTLIVNWGDGSPPQTNTYGPGIIAYNLPHQYAFTGPAFSITVTAKDDDGGVVTGTVKANPVRLTTVTRPPGGQPSLQGVGCAGYTYTLQSSSNFTNWSNVGTVTPNASNVFQYTDTTANGAARRFYRVIVSP